VIPERIIFVSRGITVQSDVSIYRFACDFSLYRLADINTQNSLSASNPRYCDSASGKISYPGL